MRRLVSQIFLQNINNIINIKIFQSTTTTRPGTEALLVLTTEDFRMFRPELQSVTLTQSDTKNTEIFSTNLTQYLPLPFPFPFPHLHNLILPPDLLSSQYAMMMYLLIGFTYKPSLTIYIHPVAR